MRYTTSSPVIIRCTTSPWDKRSLGQILQKYSTTIDATISYSGTKIFTDGNGSEGVEIVIDYLTMVPDLNDVIDFAKLLMREMQSISSTRIYNGDRCIILSRDDIGLLIDILRDIPLTESEKQATVNLNKL